MSKQPKVSVVMPSLNVVNYIRECMDSVVNQTLQEIEILCVDAGSTDGTLEILQEYAQRDDRIRLIHSEKKSYGYQLNLGIQAAKGEYMGIVETDDFVSLNMYERLYEVAKQYDLDMVKADYRKFTGSGSDLQTEHMKVCYPDLYKKVLDPKKSTRCVSFAIICSGIYKVEYLRSNEIRLNETPGASYQDNGFYFQTHCCAERLFFLDEPFYWYRQDNPNSSINSQEKAFIVFDEFDFIYQFLSRRPDLSKFFMERYCRDKFYAYWATYQRIAEEFKLPFLKRFSADFRGMKERDEFYPNLWGKEHQQIVEEILAEPEKFYFCDRAPHYLKIETGKTTGGAPPANEVALRHRIKVLEKEINDIHMSISFRIGRFITFVPRKLRGGLRCYQEHGLRYTLTRIADKLRCAFKKSATVPGVTAKKRRPQIIVSLTSFPARIGAVVKTLEPILQQTMKPDQIILWLAEEEFPKREQELPDALLALRKRGLTIEWCKNLKSHKKYLYAMKKYPDDILITIDDDLVYTKDLVERLYRSYQKNPRAISALRVHKIILSPHGGIAPYTQWPKEYNAPIGVPSMGLFATTGAGTLFPPHLLPALTLDEDAVIKLCPLADDIWLKVMEMINGVETVLVDNHKPLQYIAGTQEIALCKTNVDLGENDRQLQNTLDAYSVDYKKILAAK